MLRIDVYLSGESMQRKSARQHTGDLEVAIADGLGWPSAVCAMRTLVAYHPGGALCELTIQWEKGRPSKEKFYTALSRKQRDF